MNISNYYWYFSGVLTPRFCDDVIAYANQQKEVMARTGGYADTKIKKMVGSMSGTDLNLVILQNIN